MPVARFSHFLWISLWNSGKSPIDIQKSRAAQADCTPVAAGCDGPSRVPTRQTNVTNMVMSVTEALRSAAIGLVERFELRAADALQLAAGLGWCENQPQGRVLLTADQRLRAAALASGFDAPQIG
jgi:hypothetical protein